MSLLNIILFFSLIFNIFIILRMYIKTYLKKSLIQINKKDYKDKEKLEKQLNELENNLRKDKIIRVSTKELKESNVNKLGNTLDKIDNLPKDKIIEVKL